MISTFVSERFLISFVIISIIMGCQSKQSDCFIETTASDFDISILEDMPSFQGDDPTPSKRFLVVVDFSERHCTSCLYSVLPMLNDVRNAENHPADMLAIARNVEPQKLRQLRKIGYIPYPILRSGPDPNHEFKVSLVDLKNQVTIAEYTPRTGDDYANCIDVFFSHLY